MGMNGRSMGIITGLVPQIFATKKILLLQPSFSAAERVSSTLKFSFGGQQDNSMQDCIKPSLMLQFNKH